MAKLIRFDLPINGTKVKTLDELRENMTVEILGHYKTGLLEKWLRVRGFNGELAVLEKINSGDDADVLRKICTIFEIEVDDYVIEALLQPPKEFDGPSIESLKAAKPPIPDAPEDDMCIRFIRIHADLKNELTKVYRRLTEISMYSDTFGFNQYNGICTNLEFSKTLSELDANALDFDIENWLITINVNGFLEVILGISGAIRSGRNFLPETSKTLARLRLEWVTEIVKARKHLIKEDCHISMFIEEIGELLVNPNQPSNENLKQVMLKMRSDGVWQTNADVISSYLKIVGYI